MHLARPEHPVERATLGKADDVAVLELLLEGPVRRHAVVHPPRDLPDLRVERAAEGDVELLEAAADAEDRHTACHAFADERQGHRVAVRIEGAVLLGRLVPVVARVDVRPPAGEDEAVARLDQVADRPDPGKRRHHQRNRSGQVGDRLDVGDADRLDGVFVVDDVGVADDADDGLAHVPPFRNASRSAIIDRRHGRVEGSAALQQATGRGSYRSATARQGRASLTDTATRSPARSKR